MPQRKLQILPEIAELSVNSANGNSLRGSRLPPREMARVHVTTPPNRRKRGVVNGTSGSNGTPLFKAPMSPSAIGEAMSIIDPHYLPSPMKKLNPFLPLLKRAEGGKLVGDLYSSCFELFKDDEPGEDEGDSANGKVVYRKTVSMIDQKPPDLSSFD